jgi:hypothetical protein
VIPQVEKGTLLLLCAGLVSFLRAEVGFFFSCLVPICASLIVSHTG